MHGESVVTKSARLSSIPINSLLIKNSCMHTFHVLLRANQMVDWQKCISEVPSLQQCIRLQTQLTPLICAFIMFFLVRFPSGTVTILRIVSDFRIVGEPSFTAVAQYNSSPMNFIT